MLRSIPLRLKLLTALVLPMLVVGGYLYVDINESIERRDVAAAQRDEVDAFQAVSAVSAAIGVEHLLMNARDADPEQLAAARARTDAAYDALRGPEVGISPDRLQLVDGHYGTLLSIRETLGDVPTEARLRAASELRNGEGRTGPYSTSLADLAELPLDVLAAFDFDPAAIDDVATSALVDDYFLVQRARADIRREASTLLRVATLPGNLVDAEVTEAVSAVLAETDESLEVLAQLASIDLAGDLDSMLVSPAWTRYSAFRSAVDAAEVGERVDVDEAELRAAAADVDAVLAAQTADIVADLENRASASVFDANRDVVISGLIGLWLIIIVGLLLRFLYRAIKRPLERLTDEATHVANVELPGVIEKMRSGEIEDVPEVERIPVESKDEIGSLVEAFNDMHVSAVDLAAGQAASRRVVADMFVNLGRRNQRLVGRLLNGLSMLEQHEQDPDKLAALYDLDHTATRMRRNAESLLVLAGAGQARRWDEPVAVDDVARAAIGEVENYQRVSIDVRGEERLDGAAVSDVTHLLAELVENALTFSPPNSPVDIVAGPSTSGYVIAIADNGIGMLPDQLDEVNHRIAGAAGEDETPSEFLGHYVVGRLAARHGIRVELSEAAAGGVVARVFLPSMLLTDPESVRDHLDPASPDEAAWSAETPPSSAASTPPATPPADAVAPVPTGGTAPAPAGAPVSPVLPPPVDPMLAPLAGTGPTDTALPDEPVTPLAPSSDATDFLASLEAAGVQQRTSKLDADPDPAAPAGRTEPASAATPEPPRPAPIAPLSAPAGAPETAPASAPVDEAAPVDETAPSPVDEPAPSPVDEPAPALASAMSAPASDSPFGAPRRSPGANLPKTELIASIVGSMGSISDVRATPPAAPATTAAASPATPPPPTALRPEADPVAGDPDRVRSALSGFQQGIDRAEREQEER